MREKSAAAFLEAKKYLPGGVNSPVRAFRAVGGTPFFVDHGEGAFLYDIDGSRYVDYLLSWGPLIWGHAHPRIIDAITETAKRGTSFGAPTELETEMAREVISVMPSIEVIRMVNSGTEATMSALRLARAYTKRTCIVKFEGCYHGHADSLLVKAGSGVATFGLPDSPGVPSSTAQATLTIPYHDVDSLREVFAQRGDDIAAVIIEPVAGNFGCVIPSREYLVELRNITKQYGALLIFDEVMTGFRVSLGGAQEHFDIDPDLTTLGKVIGAGLPVGAYGGKREIMEMIAPAGNVYQAGTLSGNPLAMAAGVTSIHMLKEASTSGGYGRMQEYGEQMARVFVEEGERKGIPVYGHAIGGMFGMFFHDGPVENYDSAKECDIEIYGKFFHAMLQNGVSLAPSQLESGFMSLVHGVQEQEITLDAIRKSFVSL